MTPTRCGLGWLRPAVSSGCAPIPRGLHLSRRIAGLAEGAPVGRGLRRAMGTGPGVAPLGVVPLVAVTGFAETGVTAVVVVAVGIPIGSVVPLAEHAHASPPAPPAPVGLDRLSWPPLDP